MSIQGRTRTAEDGKAIRQYRSSRQLCATSPLPSRNALTLIELLVAITILATLAALFLGVSNSAMESARQARTKTTIAKLHSLLMERWDEYTTRRVDISSDIEMDIQSAFPNLGERGQAMADARLLALRELMKLELPDRWSDIDLDIYAGTSRFFVRDIPAITKAYSRKRETILKNLMDKGLSQADAKEQLEENGSAECLYMVIMLFTGDGEARTLFSRQDIGDTDEDGAPEFLDGWGRAIRWVRWPTGFVARSAIMLGDPEQEPDPFDPFRRNSASATPPSSAFPTSMANYVSRLRGGSGTGPEIGFRLTPMIFSMGPDGIGDISTRVQHILPVPGSRDVWLDPYDWDTEYGAYEFGSFGDNPNAPDGDDNSLDNIHNHLQDGS